MEVRRGPIRRCGLLFICAPEPLTQDVHGCQAETENTNRIQSELGNPPRPGRRGRMQAAGGALLNGEEDRQTTGSGAQVDVGYVSATTDTASRVIVMLSHDNKICIRVPQLVGPCRSRNPALAMPFVLPDSHRS